MKQLILTTAIASVFGLSAYAQTVDANTKIDPNTVAAEGQAAVTGATDAATGMISDITVPDGFQRQDISITADALLNATVYDSAGESIGEIHDLVFDLSATNGAATTGAATTGNTTTTTGDTAVTADTTATADTTTADTNATTMADATTATGTTGAAVTGSAGTTEDGQLTHAIIDIGGFLGIGERRVALPVQDLVVFSNQSETRIYLPWVRENLEALREYDENDPTTLGQPMSAAVK